MNNQKYSHIIWDWNGTLLDDTKWCIKSANIVLKKRGLPIIQSISEYRKMFCFPIMKFYERLGLDFSQEPFEELAKEYIRHYHSNKSGDIHLHKNAKTVLDYFKKQGISQVVLSASEQSNLLSQANEFEVADYFDEILGLSNIYAKSKIDIGLDYMSRKNITNAILIGDTDHDHQVAKALGIDCVLISNGHQDREILKNCGVPVLNDISCIIKYG